MRRRTIRCFFNSKMKECKVCNKSFLLSKGMNIYGNEILICLWCGQEYEIVYEKDYGENIEEWEKRILKL